MRGAGVIAVRGGRRRDSRGEGGGSRGDRLINNEVYLGGVLILPLIYCKMKERRYIKLVIHRIIPPFALTKCV